MDNNILEEAKRYQQEYLKRAEEFYDEVPEHCYKTQIKLVDENEENLTNSNGAELTENCIYLNPNASDLEWIIYHEMEHVRSAINIGKTNETGLYVSIENQDGSIESRGEASNEGIVEMAVEFLIGRKQELVGYYETTSVVRQLAAVLGISDIEMVSRYNDVNGREYLERTVNNLVGDITGKYFEKLDAMMDDLHSHHMDDMNREYEEFGQIIEKPLGKYLSKKTKESRDLVQQKIGEIPMWAKRCEHISEDEYNRRMEKFNELSPYKQNQIQNS